MILARGGVGLVVIAIAATSANDVANAVFGNERGLSAGAALFTICGIAALASIPLLQNSNFVSQTVPSLSLRINL